MVFLSPWDQTKRRQLSPDLLKSSLFIVLVSCPPSHGTSLPRQFILEWSLTSRWNTFLILVNFSGVIRCQHKATLTFVLLTHMAYNVSWESWAPFFISTVFPWYCLNQIQAPPVVAAVNLPSYHLELPNVAIHWNNLTSLLFLHILDALAVVIEVANHANDTMKQGVSILISVAGVLSNLKAQAFICYTFSFRRTTFRNLCKFSTA